MMQEASSWRTRELDYRAIETSRGSKGRIQKKRKKVVPNTPKKEYWRLVRRRKAKDYWLKEVGRMLS